MITGRTSHAAACRQSTHTCIALGPKPDLDCLPLCGGWGVLYNTPREPRLSAGTSESPVLPSCPGALWKPEPPPSSCFTCSGGPHSGLHGGLFIKTLFAHWRYTHWGSWKNFVCKGGTVSPRRRMEMCVNGNAASSCSLQRTCPLPQSPRPVSQDAQAFQPRGNLPKVSPSGPLPQRT